VMNKRAQFFLLAAVIISAVVISLGISSNRAGTNDGRDSFYDFTDEVNREVGSVIDYEIYTEVEGDLEAFVDLLADDIKDKDPDLNFVFIFGDDENMTVRNYGSDDANVGGEVVEGSGAVITSEICSNPGQCQKIETTAEDSGKSKGERRLDKEDLEGSVSIDVKINGKSVSFPISKHKQVIFIAQKEVGDEIFVTAG